jgi:hypothetical protein
MLKLFGMDLSLEQLKNLLESVEFTPTQAKELKSLINVTPWQLLPVYEILDEECDCDKLRKKLVNSEYHNYSYNCYYGHSDDLSDYIVETEKHLYGFYNYLAIEFGVE